jgi:hypothetical protein
MMPSRLTLTNGGCLQCGKAAVLVNLRCQTCNPDGHEAWNKQTTKKCPKCGCRNNPRRSCCFQCARTLRDVETGGD